MYEVHGNFSGGFQHLVINALICLDYSCWYKEY